MAERPGLLWMHHPELQREAVAVDTAQARVWEKSGWKKGKLPKKSKQTTKKSEE